MTTTNQATPPAGTRWREYKGVTYHDGAFHYLDAAYSKAAVLIGDWNAFGDDDHSALMDLKANPTEPLPETPVVRDEDWHTVRNLVAEAVMAGPMCHANENDARTDRIVRLLRREQTVDEHVAALVGFGATEVLDVTRVEQPSGWYAFHKSRPMRVLMLPTNTLPIQAPTPQLTAAQHIAGLQALGWDAVSMRKGRSSGYTRWIADSSDDVTRSIAKDFEISVHRALVAPEPEGA